MFDFPNRVAFPSLLLIAVLVLPAVEAVARPPEPQESKSSASRRDVRRAQKEADEALASRDLDAAVTRFQQLVATLPAGDPRRADALYSLAIGSLLRASEPGDVARAMQAFGELEDSYPGFKHRAEVEVAVGGLRQLAAARAEADRRSQELADLRAELGSRSAEAESCSAALASQQLAGSEESTAFEAEADALRAEVQQLRAKLAEVETELEKKEQALQKVKATLVGG